MDHLQQVEEIEDTSSKPPGTVAAIAAEEFTPSLSTQIVTDIVQAEALWRQWSPNKSLFDTWEFRYAFWHGYHYDPYFIIVRFNEEVIGMLPLWYEHDKGKYTWFGSTWQEDNSIFTTSKKFIPAILSTCPKKTDINAIIPHTVISDDQFLFEDDLSKYVLDLTTISSSNDFIQTLKKKKRYNVKRDCRIIQSQNPEVSINDFSNFEDLVRLSKQRFFQKGDEADWEDPRRVETFRQVINQGRQNKSYEVRMIATKIGGQVASVDLIAIYQGTYYCVKCAYDVASFPGIGNYVNILEIEDAIKLKCRKMDFLQIGYGWKDEWFTSVPLLKFEK